MSYEDVWKAVEVGASASDVSVVAGPAVVKGISAATAAVTLKDGAEIVWIQPSGTSQKLNIGVSSLVIDNDNTACYVAYVSSALD